MVLGGSFLQAEFIKDVVELGYEVFVFDSNPKCYVSKWKNINFYNIDFGNYQLTEKYFKKIKPNLIYAPSNEMGNLIAAKISNKFGLRYNSLETVQNTLDKFAQRKIAKSSLYVKCPKFIVLDQSIDPSKINLEFPLVVKPTSNSASRGVTCVNNKIELLEAIDYAIDFAYRSRSIIIEELLEGQQISVETVSVNGKHFIIGLTQEIVSDCPKFIERCHFMSKQIHSKYYERLKEGIDDLLNCFNIMYGPCHIELKVTDKDIFLIEIASRAGGLRDVLMKCAKYPSYNELIIKSYTLDKFDKELISPLPPQFNALVNILMKLSDQETIKVGKKNNVLHSVYFNKKTPKDKPTSLLDSYGYSFFSSPKSLKEYSNQKFIL